jgi:outer membrane receptor protein involved in Fe transport
MNLPSFKKIPLSAAIASLCFISGAMAQEFNTSSNANNVDGLELEEITIVGTRIKRRDEYSTSPVQTLGEEDLRVSGSLSMGEVLQELPSVGSSLNSNGSAGTSYGTSSLNLRSLGENRSLVMVNGHRWVNGAGGRGFRDFVDLNTIPQAIVERVEVLQDGATAIYGADAIAGVVNIHTYDDFNGARLKAYYGESSEGDRGTQNIDFLWGKDIGDSNWMLAVSYMDQDPIYTQDRSLTAVPLNGLTAGTPEGLFRESGLAGVVDFPVPSGGITRDAGVDGSDISNWRAVDSTNDRFNRYHNNYIVGPQERTSIYLQNKTKLTSSMEFSLEFLYNKRESDQLFSAVPPVIRGSRGFAIANDPAVNPFGIEFSGSDFRVNNFFVDNGQRDNLQEVETLRIGMGLSGEFDNGWGWDGFLSWAENEGSFTSVNQIHLDKLALGLLACDSSGISADVSDLEAGCVPVNLFNPLTPEMIDYINFTGKDENKAEQLDFTLNVSGELMELPAGMLAFAAGMEYREEQGLDKPDSVINSSPRINTYRTTTSSPRVGTDAEYDLTEFYTEVSVPLLADKPLAKILTLDLAARYSDYSTFGGTTNGKVGVAYRPVEDLLIRGTWAEGFRSPSLLELFEGQRTIFQAVEDPCSGGGAGLVGCEGVSVDYIQDSDANVLVVTEGNENLEPETSDNLSLGFVFTPSFWEGTSLTLDWYNIEVDNLITDIDDFGAEQILQLCANTGQSCNMISRNSAGEILGVDTGPINLNSVEVEGIDAVFRYETETDLGNWDFTLSLSKLNQYTESTTLPDGTLVTEDKRGTSARRESYPEWRGSFLAKLAADNWSANYTLRYIGDTEESFGGETHHISSTVYHNVSGSYNFSESLSLKVGVDNLTDKQPPASYTNLNINFDQNTYTAVGRFMYLQLVYDFEV